MDQDKIGNFIKSIRLEKKLTQKELADILGVTYQAVSKWENGKNIPDLSIIKKICDEFNINIDELLNGVKKGQKHKHKKIGINTIIALSIVIVLFGIYIVNNINSRSFEFKTISSQCRDFIITGSAAYNRAKTSIYISNIEFCGKNDSEMYNSIECTLYEKSNDTKTKVSSCDRKKNITLKDYLKDLDIQVNNYSTTCKKFTSNTLSLEIKAINKDNRTITYNIPIKLNDDCK